MMIKIESPGIYDISAADYHADPCPVPSLSRSIAHLLVTRSPMHAHYHHPRLGGGEDIEASKAMDAGSAVHAMVLGKGAQTVPLKSVYGSKHERAGQPVTDYATKDAQAERSALREAGHIPCLAHELPEWQRAAASIMRHLRVHQDGADFFATGRSEATVIWREDDIWLRIMVDRLPDDPQAPAYDLKLTKLAAAPQAWEQQLRKKYAFQDAFYRRGLAAIRKVTPPPMRFVVGEIDPPYGVSVMTAAPSLAALADAEVERAVRVWRQCLISDRWPGYPLFTAHVEAPTWMVVAAEERELRDEMMGDAP